MANRALWQIFGGVLLIIFGAVFAFNIALTPPLMIALGIGLFVVGILLLAGK